MKTFEQVEEWCAGAAEALGDPSKSVYQLFVRYRQDLVQADIGDELICGMADDELVLALGPDFLPYPLPIEAGAGRYNERGIEAYGMELVANGVWSIAPSFFVPGVIHAFLVVYDVPDPAPWERQLILPPGVRA